MIKNVQINLPDLTLYTGYKAIDCFNLEKDNPKKASNILTDMALLTGARVSYQYYTYDHKPEQIGYTLTRTICGDHIAIVNDSIRNETDASYEGSDRFGTIRPILQVDSFEEVLGTILNEEVIYLGNYPQWAAPGYLQWELNQQFNAGKLKDKKTGEYFSYCLNGSTLVYQEAPVYRYQNKKYICVISHYEKDKNLSCYPLSNGEDYLVNQGVWVEISPVPWMVDSERKILISKYGLLAGVPYHPQLRFKPDDYESTHIKDFLDNVLLPNLFQKEEVKKISKSETTFQSDYTFVKERLGLLRLTHPEFSEELDPILKRVERMNEIVKKDYQKIKK